VKPVGNPAEWYWCDFRRTSHPCAHSAQLESSALSTQLIDAGKITFTNNEGELESRYFLGVASFGMSADVIARVKEGGPDWLPTKGLSG